MRVSVWTTIYSRTTSWSTRAISTWHRSTQVFEHHRWRALGVCSIHVPSLAISVTLLVLNFSCVFYGDIGLPRQNLQFNALQFAAKCHEVLITASLSTVAINYIRYELSHGRGLSLGGVLAGFQITNLNSLWGPNSGFWHRCATPGFRARRVHFMLLVIVLVILTAAVGPSSAILMLPTIGWWNAPYRVDRAFVDYTLVENSKVDFFFDAAESVLWPTRITLADFPPPADCNFTSSSIPEHCPAGGLPVLLSQPAPWEPQLNITMPMTTFTYNVYNRFLESVTEYFSEVSCSMSQSIATSVGNMLDIVLQTSDDNISGRGGHVKHGLSLANGTQLPAPQTLSICSSNLIKVTNGSYWNQSTGGVQLSFLVKDSQDLPSAQNWTIDANSLLQLWNESNPSAAVWIEPPYLADNMPSIAAAFVTINDQTMTAIEIVTCSIYASWQEIGVYIDPTVDSAVHTSVNDDYQTALWNGKWEFVNGTQIQLDADWANVALPMNDTIIPLALNASYPGAITGVKTRAAVVGNSLSLLLTDAMARIAQDVAIIFASAEGNATKNDYNQSQAAIQMNLTDVDKRYATEVAVITMRYGYSYSTSGITRLLAAGVLLLHIGVALIHTLLVVGFALKTPGPRSLFDVVNLAFNSQPITTTLGDTNSKEHKSVIKIRESSASQLEFVVVDEKLR